MISLEGGANHLDGLDTGLVGYKSTILQFFDEVFTDVFNL
jgi:hypothetical protein